MTLGAPNTDGERFQPPSTVEDPLRPFDKRSTTAAATKQVLFGHLHTEDAASAVARRLRTAIGLGVLTDGEKLPKEVDLGPTAGCYRVLLARGF